MMQEISSDFESNFISATYCHAFEVYCKNADALLDYNNLRPGKTIAFYGTRFYPDKMIEMYGKDYMVKFDNWIHNEDRMVKVRSLLKEAKDVLMAGISDNLKLDKEGSKNDV